MQPGQPIALLVMALTRIRGFMMFLIAWSGFTNPGRLQLRVRDTDATVKALTASGGQLITVGGNGGPIDMRGLRVGIVRELNDLFLVIFTQPPAAVQRQ